MRLHQLNERNQSGFSIIEVLLVVLIVVVLAVSGFVVYQRHKSISVKNSTATNSTQLTSKPQNTKATQPEQSTTPYLTIKEWSVKLPLSSSINDAYYSVGGNVGTDGLPNTIWLGLTSLNSRGCDASNDDSPSFKPIGSIVRVFPTDTDPISGKLYTQLVPNGTTINGYYYGYSSWSGKNSSCASAATLQSIDSAFVTAAKGIVQASQYLTIPEQGIRIKLTANTEDAYYSIGKTSTAGIPPYIVLSVHSLDAYPGCSATQGNAGIAEISTFSNGETDPVVGNFMTTFPNAPEIGSRFYYVSGSQYDCSEGKASTIYSNAKHDFIDAYNTIEKIPN